MPGHPLPSPRRQGRDFLTRQPDPVRVAAPIHNVEWQDPGDRDPGAGPLPSDAGDARS